MRANESLGVEKGDFLGGRGSSPDLSLWGRLVAAKHALHQLHNSFCFLHHELSSSNHLALLVRL